MAEFKRLSDVEVVAEPIESANVLIEENGIIKKAPKTTVGGGSGEADGSVFTVNLNESYSPDTDSMVYTADKSYDEIAEAFESGKYVICRCLDSLYHAIDHSQVYKFVSFISVSGYGSKCLHCSETGWIVLTESQFIRKEQFPAITEIGKAIVVRSYDMDGSIASFEYVDLNVVTSSNGTKWKIAVDDTGNLTTSQVND